ncbi:MAG: glycosyl hydrolase family 18 protein [Eubacteriales bacterium]|nr:glycosyl hydrolase family 18 protein [Eubacteriales bacterium]
MRRTTDEQDKRARERAKERRLRRQERMRRQGRAGGRRRGISPVLVVVILILIFGGAFGGRLLWDRYSYSSETADLNAYFGITDEQDVPVILQDELSQVHARLIDGVYYMDFNSVQTLLNDRFYYGQNDSLVLYCLPTDMVSTEIGSTQWSTTQGGTVTESYPLTRMEGDTLYLALDFVKQYTNFSYEAFTEPNRMQIYTEWGDVTTAAISKDTQVRISGGVKSTILTQIGAGSRIYVLEKMDTWSRIKTEDGFIGYVENKRLEDEATESLVPVTDYEEPSYTTIRLPGKVNMAWHSVAGTAGNDTLNGLLAQTQSINVISPTWFVLSDNSGNIESYATEVYVEEVHGRDMQVWALVENFTNPNVDPNTVLTTLASRQNLISQLISQCEQYGIDGINVDFENIGEAYGQDYIEFIRELSIACRNAGLVLSVSNYVPYNFNHYYELEEQGVWADYIVVMGYDEHYAGSTEAGSVASLGYVENGITSALRDVPAEKLINAIPFYARLWKTDSDGLSSQALGMQEIQNFIAAHNMQVSWSEAAGQNYAETTEDGTLYQIWIEDAESIAAKLSVMEANGIAGVAEWRLGFETADVWDVIAAYMAQ